MMLSRLKELSARLHPGEAYRFSRGISGAATGFVFTLFGVAHAPLNKIGLAAPLFALSASIMAYVKRMRDSYKDTDPDGIRAKIRGDATKHSMKFLLQELQENPANTSQFLSHYKIDEPGNLYQTLTDTELKALIEKIDQATHGNPHQYFIALLGGISQVMAHYGEVMLARVLYDEDLFNIENGFNVDNAFLGIITMLALYNGVQAFRDAKRHEEHPGMPEVCARIYDKFKTFHANPYRTADGMAELPRFGQV